MAREGMREPARVRYLRCVDAPLEGEVDAFYAFFVLDGRIMSVHRRFNLDLPGCSHTRERYRSSIVLTTYAASDAGLRPDNERVLFSGEDPRVVSDGRRAFILCRTFDASGQSPAEYRLAILPDGVEREIVPPPPLKGGKNWQPFLRDGRLFAVWSFAPLTVVEITDQGQMHVAHQRATELWLPAAHDRYTMLRGGSNAMVAGDTVVGLGHLTRCRDDHRPFCWVLDSSMQMTLSFSSAFFGLRAKGFNIVDPTSLFMFGDRLHLGLCCSEREWFYGQRFLNMLVELPCSDVGALSGPHCAEMFVELAGSSLAALPRSRTFIPGDLPHQIGRRQVDGGVESEHEAGCLVYGPYEAIECDGAQVAALTYRASSDRHRSAGRFEVSCCRDGRDDVLAAVDLGGTSGRIATVELPFHTSGHLGWLLETRVFADGRGLNVLNIRIMGEAASTSTTAGDPQMDDDGASWDRSALPPDPLHEGYLAHGMRGDVQGLPTAEMEATIAAARTT